MANKKAKSTKTTVRTIKADEPIVTPVEAPVVKPTSTKVIRQDEGALASLPSNTANIMLAEVVGTFILTAVALTSVEGTGSLYVGLALAVIVMAVGAISGAHVNPAVTFGLWSMKKLRSIMLPVYWVAQIVGAMLAFFTIKWISGDATGLSFDGISSLNWPVFGAEMVGAAVFMFGIAAITTRRNLHDGARAIGLGLALTTALIVGTTCYTAIRNVEATKYQEAMTKSQNADGGKNTPAFPHIGMVKGVTLNPAVALAVTDNPAEKPEAGVAAKSLRSRISLEVILGTLLGAAVGGNLYMMIAGRRYED